MKKLLFILVLSLLFCSCSFEVPKSVFSDLVNEDVIAPMAGFDTASFTNENVITFEVAIPEEVKSKIVDYKWKIQNIFGDILASSNLESFSQEGLPADDYIAILTISAKVVIEGEETKEGEEGEARQQKEIRSFSKKFTVMPVETEDTLAVTGLDPLHDTGYSSEDGITSYNSMIKVNGKADPSISVVLRVKCSDPNYSEDFTGTTDDTGAVSFVIPPTGTLSDGIYECKLYREGEFSIGSDVMFLTIDTTAPVLSWKNDAPSTPVEYASSVLKYHKTTCDEILVEPEYVGNYEGASALKGFSPYICGTQHLTVSGSDKAGNKAVSISRDLTISEPVDASLVNGDFEATTGLTGKFGEKIRPNYVEGNGAATGWDIFCSVGLVYGGWRGSHNFDTGIGAFTFVESDPSLLVHRTWQNYSCACVLGEEGHSGNSFWFSGVMDCEATSIFYSKCYYTQAVGKITQKNIAVKKYVPYKLTMWVKVDDGPKPDVPVCVKILSSGSSFDIDGDRKPDIADEMEVDIPALGKDWVEISKSFIPDQDCEIEVVIEKFKKGSAGIEKEDGFSMFLDDVAVKIDKLEHVD